MSTHAHGDVGEIVNSRILYIADSPANTTPAIAKFMTMLPACMPSEAQVSPDL